MKSKDAASSALKLLTSPQETLDGAPVAQFGNTRQRDSETIQALSELGFFPPETGKRASGTPPSKRVLLIW